MEQVAKKSKSESMWSTQENEILLEEVIKEKEILFGHHTDSVTNSLKEQKWIEIAKCISLARPGKSPRTWIETRKKWFNLSNDAKQDFAKEKNSIKGTGGGPGHTMKPFNSRIIEEVIGRGNPTLAGNSIPGGFDSDMSKNVKRKALSALPPIPSQVQSTSAIQKANVLHNLSLLRQCESKHIKDGSLIRSSPSQSFQDSAPPSPVKQILPSENVIELDCDASIASIGIVVHQDFQLDNKENSDQNADVSNESPLLSNQTKPKSLPRSLRQSIARAKLLHVEKSEVSVSKKLLRDRFELLTSIAQFKAIQGTPLKNEEIPTDLAEVLNNVKENV